MCSKSQPGPILQGSGSPVQGMPLQNNPPASSPSLLPRPSFLLPTLPSLLQQPWEVWEKQSWQELQRPSGTQGGILAPLGMMLSRLLQQGPSGVRSAGERPCELGRALGALLSLTGQWPSWLTCTARDSSACCSAEPLRVPCSVSDTL